MQAKFVGRWVPSGNSMTTGYPGSSFSFRVSGTSYVNVGITGATRIAYAVDDGAYVVTNNVQITGLTLSTHKIKIVLSTSSQTWAENNYAQVTGIEVASGGSIIIEPATKRKCLVFGDSITEGWNITAEYKPTSELTWWNKLSDMLNMDITPVGIGGIGFTAASNTYPSVKSVPSYIENITSSSVVSNTDYDLVIIELGTNDWKSKTEVDSNFVTDVTSVINRIKSKYPNADIHALIPFTLNGQPSLNQAYGNTNVNIIPTSWYSSITFTDNLHPNEAGNATIANNVKNYFLNKYGESYFKEVTMKRIDTIYIDTNGAVQKATGTMADNPVKPTLPAGAIKVADVVIEQGASTGTIADNRDWLKRYSNLCVANVKDYGAKGDGTTDDTAAIQAAIDNNKGKIIQFPYGTYLISSPIYTYRGDTKRSLLLLNKAVIKASPNFPATSFMVIIGDESTGNINNYWDSHSMCGLIGGIIDGNNVAYGGVKYLESSLGKLMDFSVVGVTDIGVQVGLPNLSYAWSTDIYISRLSIDGTYKENSVGLLVYSYDNNIEYVRTANYPIGIRIIGGGNYLRECHPLYFEPVYNSEVGFDIQGNDTKITDCYSDGFRTCIKTNGAFPLTVNGFFGYYPDSITKDCAFVENTQDYCSFIIRDSRVRFSPNSSTNIGYKVNQYTRTYQALGEYGFFDVIFNNITNENNDYAINSPLAHNIKRSLDNNYDLNNMCASGIYSLERLNPSDNLTQHRPDLNDEPTPYYGILEINSKAGKYQQTYDVVVQTFYVANSTKKYKRTFFGVYDSEVEGTGWTSWIQF